MTILKEGRRGIMKKQMEKSVAKGIRNEAICMKQRIPVIYMLMFLVIFSCVTHKTFFVKADGMKKISVDKTENDEVSVQSVTFDDLSDGEYFCYKKIKWGTSKEEVERELNISLEYWDESIQTHYTDKVDTELEGMNAKVTYEFRPDLEVVSFCVDIQGEEQFNQILEELEDKYGESESGGSKEEGWVGYRWFKENEDLKKTSLQIIADYEKNILSEVNIYVGIIHQDAQDEKDKQ